MKEQDIQKQIKDCLSVFGWYVVKNNTVGIYRQDTGHYIPSTCKGLADLTAIKNSRVVMIEVKQKGNKQSPDQKQFEKDWIAHGGEYWLVFSLEDLLIKLRQ